MSVGTIFSLYFLEIPWPLHVGAIISYLCIPPSYTISYARCVFLTLTNPLPKIGWHSPLLQGEPTGWASPETMLKLFFILDHIHTLLSPTLFSPFPFTWAHSRNHFLKNLSQALLLENPTHDIFPAFSRPVLRAQPPSWICLFSYHCDNTELMVLH